MTDQEINEAVAQKLGKTWCPTHTHTISGKHGNTYCPGILNDYCHSIAAAWEIVERLGFHWELRRYQRGNWSSTLATKSMTSPSDFITVRADKAPMAICLAFLKLDTK